MPVGRRRGPARSGEIPIAGSIHRFLSASTQRSTASALQASWSPQRPQRSSRQADLQCAARPGPMPGFSSSRRTSAASITQETEPTVSRLVGQRGDPGPRGADSLVASPAKTRPRHLCPSRRSWRWAAAPAPECGAGSQADVSGRPVHLTAATEGRSVWSSAPRRRGVRELRRRALGHEGRPSVRGARTARSERDRALRAAVRALPPAVSGPASHDARSR